MNLYLIGAAMTVGVVLGRTSARHRVDQAMRNPRIWYAMAAFVLVVNSSIATVYLVGDNRTLRGEGECRARLAAPVNSAEVAVLVGQARGLVVFVAQSLDDPQFTALVRRKPPAGLGNDGVVALREQGEAILKASSEIERANRERGVDPVAACRGKSK